MKNEKTIGRKIRHSYTVSTVSIMLVLLLLGMVSYVTWALFDASRTMRQSVTMIVELDNSVCQAQRDTIASRLMLHPIADSVRFLSKEEKLADEEFRKAFAIDIEGVLSQNPLPDSFDVVLSEHSSDKQALEEFVAECSKIEGVTHITYPEKLLSNMHSAIDVVQLLLVGFGALMLVIALILLSNTIRLSVYSQREVISTLKLVGATKWFIIKPLLGRALLQGLLTGTLAALVFCGALYGIDYALPTLGIATYTLPALIIAAAMVVAGIVLVGIFTLVTVSRYVNMKSNKIHLY